MRRSTLNKSNHLIEDKIDQEVEKGLDLMGLSRRFVREEGINLERFYQFLNVLDFITDDDTAYVRNIYKMMNGDKKKGLIVYDLKVVLCGIKNIYLPSFKKTQIAVDLDAILDSPRTNNRSILKKSDKQLV